MMQITSFLPFFYSMGGLFDALRNLVSYRTLVSIEKIQLKMRPSDPKCRVKQKVL